LPVNEGQVTKENLRRNHSISFYGGNNKIMYLDNLYASLGSEVHAGWCATPSDAQLVQQ
jgi:hypothetical protein